MKKILLATSVALGAVQMASAQAISFWTTEEQPDRLAKQVAWPQISLNQTGIVVQVIPVTESENGDPRRGGLCCR